MLDEVRRLFRRDLDGMVSEVSLYPDDESPWTNVDGCPNPGGTLVLHAIGNARHFIGAQLGDSGYVRERDAEFATRGLTRGQLIALVETAKDEVDAALGKLTAADLDRPAAVPPTMLPPGGEVSTGQWVLHLLTHLTFHLGQLDYHRRAATGDASSAAPLPIRRLV